MKKNCFDCHAPLPIAFAGGFVIAPVLVAAGHSLISAYSALITVMFACYFVEKCSR